MKPYCICCFIILIFALYGQGMIEPLNASAMLILGDLQETHVLPPHMDFLEDKQGNLTIDDVASPKMVDRFAKFPSDIVHFGFSSAVFWGRLSVVNISKEEYWVLMHNSFFTAPIDSVELYVRQGDGQFKVFRDGEFVAPSGKMVKFSPFPAFILHLPQDDEVTIYLRLQDESLTNLPLGLLSTTAVKEFGTVLYFFMGVLGAIVLFLVYSLLLFLSLRDSVFLYFSLFLTGVLLNGLLAVLFRAMPDLSVWLMNRLKESTRLIEDVAWLMLFRQYFQIKRLAPRLDVFFLVLLSILIFAFFGLFILSYPLATWLIGYLILIEYLGLLVVTVYCLFNRYVGARYFTVSVLIATYAEVIPLLNKLGWISFESFFSVYYFGFLELTFLFFFSVAFIDRYNQIRQRMVLDQQQALVSIRRSEKLKDEFLANTSHELRTPLHGIIGLCEDLLVRGKSAIQSGWDKELNLVIHCAQRLSSLVDDILDFSRIRRNELKIVAKPLDFRRVCSVVLAICRPMIGQKQLAISTDMADSLPPIMADEDRLQQILLNLLGNAVKFTHEGSINVTAKTDGPYLKVSIADTGIGIAPDKQTGIFDHFSQVDASVNREHGGTGLGLAISKTLIELQGGEIHLSSKVNQGSIFSFTLPLAESGSTDFETRDREPPESIAMESAVENLPMVSSTSLPKPAASSSDPSQRILIVDDDAISLQTLHNHLKTAGYEVDAAQDGFQARETIARHVPDLVVLDVMMPRMSGYELCGEIRRSHNLTEMPIIMLTAGTRTGDIVDGFNSGANDYLTKPVNRKELLARVQTSFELKRLADLLRENADLKNEIAERNRVEIELMTANRRLAEVLDSWETAIVVVDNQKRIQFFNQRAEQVFGYQTHRIIMQPLKTLLPNHSDIVPDQKPDTLASYPHAVNELCHATARAADGTEFPLEIVVTPVTDKVDGAYALICRKSSQATASDRTNAVNVAEVLSRNRRKMSAMQAAFDGALRFLDREGNQFATDLTDTDRALESAFARLSREKVEELFRGSIVEVMTTALERWNQATGKDKIQMAAESKIWKVQRDGSAYRTRTLDNYLDVERLPKNPRWKDVVKTAEFVMSIRPESHPLRSRLEASLSKLTALIKARI